MKDIVLFRKLCARQKFLEGVSNGLKLSKQWSEFTATMDKQGLRQFVDEYLLKNQTELLSIKQQIDDLKSD